MRQTNAVWVTFITAQSMLRQIRTTNTSKHRTGSGIVDLLKTAWSIKSVLAHTLWPLLAVIASFIVFVVRNKGIVVGDKDHHTPVTHWVQLMYCSAYITLVLAPLLYSSHTLQDIRQLCSGSGSTLSNSGAGMGRKAKAKPRLNDAVVLLVVVLSTTCICWLCIAKGTLIHPFLVADNRHYPFYVWRKVINRTPWARYALIPVYVYSVLGLASRLVAGGWGGWEVAGVGVAAVLVLVPAHLLEFRYYTMVFYTIFLMGKAPVVSSRGGRWGVGLTVVGAAVVNAVTLYVFARRPFTWEDGSVARFMW